MTSGERSWLPAVRDAHSLAAARAQRAREAQDYAALLVSDLRLYHEQEVIAGRASRDLGRRLGGGIASAREQYLKRFGDEGIFDQAVVRILAGGDPGTLG